MNKGKWHRTRYGVYKITLHCIFVVKYRRKVLTNDFLRLIEKICKRVCQEVGCALVEFGGEDDHVHLLLSISPKIEIYKLMGRLKGASSYEVRKKFGKQLKRKLWGKHLWSPSYFVVSCGGASLDVIKQYVKHQGRA